MAEATPDLQGPIVGRDRRPLWLKSLLMAATAAAFLVAATIGAIQNARGERVLPVLDPLISLLRTHGPGSLQWLLMRSRDVACLVTAAASGLALVALLRHGRRAAPIVVLASAAGFATWGQILLLANQRVAGAFLYGVAIASAFALGLLRPLVSLRGFPVLPDIPPARGWRRKESLNTNVGGAVPDETTPPLPRLSTWECGLVFAITVFALLLRATLLTELPSGFDMETIASMIQSRTAHGVRQYYDRTFLTTAPGVVHIFTQWLMFALFGTSVYSIRLAALLWGVAAIPLFYWLMRRIAGIAPAILTTLLFAAAPEQLFWSRTENVFFAPVTIVALVSAHLGLWMVQRLSFRATVAAALCMPFCRYFYTPAFVLFVYPLALFAHACLFVRRAWQKSWYVIPVLAGGTALWIYSLSLVRTVLNGGHWQFVDPSVVYGAAAWRKHGDGAFRQADLAELVRLQVELFKTNMQQVIEGATIHGPRMFSHWFERMHFLPEHSVLLNVALTIILVIGLAYLLAQLNERRAFALLAWIALGLLPGVMSNEPSGRRIAVIFPAVYAVAGVMLAATARLVREQMGPWLASFVTALLALVGGAILWSSLVSHFMLPIAPFPFGDQIRFARPLFDESDAIFTDLEERAWRLGQAFGNLDRFLERKPCYQYVAPRDWLRTALRPECAFTDELYWLTMSDEEVNHLHQSYAPRRVTYVLGQTPSGRERTAQLVELYPSASVRQLDNRAGEAAMVALTVDVDAIDALRFPWLILPPGQSGRADLERRLLAGVQLVAPPDGTALEDTSGAIIRGGLLLDADGWYRLRLEPACEGASFAIDGRPADEPQARPLLAGVHSFEIRLPDPGACTAPLQILIASFGQEETPAAAAQLVEPRLASLPSTKAPDAVTYAGEGPAELFASLQGRPKSLGLDARGWVSVLFWESFRGWRVDRFSPQGQLEHSWRPEVDSDRNHVSMVVAADGTHFFLSGEQILITDGVGNAIGGWKLPLYELATEIALWPDNRLLAVYPNRHSIALLSRDGKLLQELKSFAGGPGRFSNPMAMAIGPGGHLLVLQYDGLALLFFQDPNGPWSPELLSTFRVAFSKLPAETGGVAFDGANRILIPDRAAPATLVYTLGGERMLAADPEGDLGTHGFGTATGFDSSARFLYVLDEGRNAVWRIAR